MLKALGYIHLKTVNNIAEAYRYASTERPTLVITDTFLGSHQTGTDLMRMLASISIPLILTTNSQDLAVYNTASQDLPIGYLVKPFYAPTLKSTIDLLLHYQKSSDSKSLFVHDHNNKTIRVFYDEILYLHSERNYCFIHTQERKFVIKRSLLKMRAYLDNRFLRVHSSYLINADHIKKIETDSVQIQNNKVPIGRSYKKAFLQFINPLEK